MEIEPIGFLRTCFGSKFAVPRQPGLCPSAWGYLEFSEKYRSPDSVRGLDGFSHVWLVFGFHQTVDEGWRPTVRPPRLGGEKRVGVFASRSTYRPNGLGLSLVKLENVFGQCTNGMEPPVLEFSGVDLVDGTPVYDIKPYLPYAESLPDAESGYAAEPIRRFRVEAEPECAVDFQNLDERSRRVITEVLSLDPRPAGGGGEFGRIFGATICGRNIRFRFDDTTCWISGIEVLK